jgi:hypothetical protein
MSTLFFSKTVPSETRPGSPFLYFCDNGDWDIAFAGDLSYIEDYTSAYVGGVSVITIFNELADMADQEEMDDDGEVVHLLASIEVPEDAMEAPVLELGLDGSCTPSDRWLAEKSITSDTFDIYNFIPLTDFFEELARFIANNKRNMFDDREMDPPYMIEDED